ncbi:MAG: class I SAM-dependent methyltransferase [Selenomonadaceae bacterium]|nr:class I SAM-dependent methyltransferase [Selenomonadaceae bacterium]
MENFIVTTTRKPDSAQEIFAEEISQKLGGKFIQREDFSFDLLKKNHDAENILLVKKNSLSIVTAEGELFFHPNTAHLRIKNLRGGEGDRLIDALKISDGSKVLDCTLGLGSDAIVESFIVGAAGKVVALEINPLIAEIVSHGLKNFSDDSPHILEAMRRVKVINTDCGEFLKTCADNSFDVVYFDPMFRRPIKKSSGLNPIRPLADNRPLAKEIIAEACRVAKFRVVLKEHNGSSEFVRLGFKIVDGGKYSSVAFGVIDKNFFPSVDLNSQAKCKTSVS